MTGSFKASAQNDFRWPNNTLAAVSLSYDDALHSQLNNAVPILNKYRFKGSFYLTLNSPVFKLRRKEWQMLASQGHELGNHTINHACRGSLPNRAWVKPNNDLDNKTIKELVSEVKKANNILTTLDNQTRRTFSLPCSDNLTSDGDYLKAVSSLFIGIQSKIDTIPTKMSTVNVKDMSVISAANLSGSQLINYVKQAEKNGTMVNFTFHGIGDDYLSTSSEAHNALVEYLARNKKRYWVDTVINISSYISHYDQ